MHYWHWFDIASAWIGGVGAIVLSVLLFATNRLRSDPSRSRWHDWVWLSWIGTAAYLLHNFEEYGIDLLGTFHAFPGMICAQPGLPPYPNCPIPPVFFLAVNVTAFWVAAPIAALLSRRHPLVGLSIYGIIIINALVHMAAALGGSFGGGFFTSLLFVVLAVWVIRACFGPGRMSYGALALLVAGGIIVHMVLAAPLVLFVNFGLSATVVVLLQLMNPFLLMLILWLGERWRDGVLISRTRGPTDLGRARMGA
ncbi:HXXEE domain-containing protein [Rhizobium sp. LC145]|uniref:HXXEE domain-containing protein n=1 Tax=Rhizobium sp. LC145 TaxID=1120688 RepID=UPI000699EC17|nr:HXXEE domain-containing protein [Rhizobium sp. LC145]TKT57759.1 HXXEE domain-containing protein [Rhizobiaceae bacterium LC148]